jgi:hypothetical protein
MSEYGLKDTGREFHTWLEDWVSGVDLWKRLVVLEDRVMVNPFTKQVQTVKVVSGTTGKRYLFRALDGGTTKIYPEADGPNSVEALLETIDRLSALSVVQGRRR